MAAAASATAFPKALFDFDHLEPAAQKHLQKVYSCLSIGLLSAALGAYADAWLGFAQWSFVSAIASIGLLIWLFATKQSGKEEIPKRMLIFSAFTFLTGTSLRPLLDYVVMVDPSIISTALLGTAVIFISFSLAALLSRNRSYLFLGGILLSSLNYLLVVQLFALIFRSQLAFDVSIYGSLVLFSLFVVYDTQLIVEKRRHGDEDFIWHSVDLFLDAIHIFRSLLIILSKKEEKKRRRND